MADVVAFTSPGTPIEKVGISVSGDTALAQVSVTYSTSVFTSNEAIIRALMNIIARLEGYTFPPTNFTP